MKKIPLALLILFSVCVHPALWAQGMERASIDVSSQVGLEDWKQALDGDWEFYWQAHIQPQDFTSNLPTPEFFHIPGGWNADYPSHGFATIRFVVHGLEDTRTYALDFPEILTAHRVFINGEEVFHNGVAGTDRSNTVPQFRPGIVVFQSQNGRADIVCHISNFDHCYDGIWRSITLGPAQTIAESQRRRFLLAMFIAAVLFTISLFHIGVYVYRRVEIAELYFGLSCLFILFRNISTGEQLLTQLMPNFPWGVARWMEYSPFFLLAPLFMLFITSLFPRESIQKINRFFIYAYIPLAAFFTVFPVRITSHAILPGEILLLTVISYVLFVLGRAVAARRKHSLPIMAAFFLLALMAVNDILYSYQLIQTGYLVPLGFIVFIIIQSQLLLKRYAESFNEVTDLSQQLTQINASMSRFVPFQFLEYLKKKSILDVQLGDQVLENMTVLFADIRSFTTLSEAMTPEENFSFLNSFLSRLVPVIRQKGGFVDKFIGDAIMALFPFPPDQAVRAAIELQNVVNNYNQGRDRAGYRGISLGIGIHTGPLMLGTIGETNRMETTVIADAVNIAARLEQLTKTYGASIIISKDLYDVMEDVQGIACRQLGSAVVKGKAAPLEIVEIFDGSDPEKDNKKKKSLNDFEKALALIQKKKCSKAIDVLEKIVAADPEDNAAAYYLSCCRDQLES